MIYFPYWDSTRDIQSNIPFAFRSSLGLHPRELLQAKGYIWPYIPPLVLLRIQCDPTDQEQSKKNIFISEQVSRSERWWRKHRAIAKSCPEHITRMLSRPCPKAPLVMKQLLPPILLFHFLPSFKFLCFWHFFWPFSNSGNFLMVRDPPYGEKFENHSKCWFW